MPSLRQLKEQVEVNNDIAELFEVLKNIAIGEYYKWEKKHTFFDTLNESIAGFFDLIQVSGLSHPLVNRQSGPAAIVVMTSDDGFTGGLNDRVMERARQLHTAKNILWIVVGERGQRIVQSMGHTLIEAPCFNALDPQASVQELKKVLIETYLQQDISSLSLVYARPRSFSLQKIEVLSLLPCVGLFDGVAKNTAHDRARDGSGGSKNEVLLESSPEMILDQLIQRWLDVRLLQVYEMSKLSEYAARSLQLEQSTRVLEEQARELNFSYVRAKRQRLDTQMREAFTAQLVRSKV